MHRNEAEVLATHTEAKLKHLVGGHIHEVRHLEFADIVLVLVDVVVLEANGVLVNPRGFTFQGRREIESLGGNVLAVLHLEHFRIAETHHDGLTCSDNPRGVAVQEGQQVLTDGLDALNESFASTSRCGSFLAARRQKAK